MMRFKFNVFNYDRDPFLIGMTIKISCQVFRCYYQLCEKGQDKTLNVVLYLFLCHI